MKHEIWLWLWFFVGAGIYWLKRAYYLVTGPSPVANTYAQFVQRCWIPLLVRTAVDSAFFWLLFTPGVADKGLEKLGWTNWSWVVMMITQFAAFAFCFGMTVDVGADFALSKIPLIKDWLPQMPSPLPPISSPQLIEPSKP